MHSARWICRMFKCSNSNFQLSCTMQYRIHGQKTLYPLQTWAWIDFWLLHAQRPFTVPHFFIISTFSYASWAYIKAFSWGFLMVLLCLEMWSLGIDHFFPFYICVSCLPRVRVVFSEHLVNTCCTGINSWENNVLVNLAVISHFLSGHSIKGRVIPSVSVIIYYNTRSLNV